ncbi:MAG: DUF1810 domain-containing protein [Solirubrobacteraceae bacterium]
MAEDDPYYLRRFVAAQDAGGAHDAALAQLRAGRKTGHWIWFVLPQIAGLGHSEMSRRYAISGIEEARAYLAHPVLGPRLHGCARALLELDGERTAEQVMGAIDALKLRSSMTLFARAAPGEPLFAQVLERYFGAGDPATEARI